jgi:alkylation response protein AidB-like acyl-CoA dehydrogenase
LGIDKERAHSSSAQRAIRPILERNAETTDSRRRLADENVQALKDAGLCRLMVPARLGGHQTSVRTYIDVMAELGRGCGRRRGWRA